MNERVKELAEQADIKFDVYSDNYGVDTATVVPYDLEKFAELIIQDCVTQVALLGISNFENEDIMWAVETSIENIKERFGITQ